MSIWNPKQLQDRLAGKAKELGIRMPQVQNLLAQERFMSRLAQTEYGTRYVWKGGSLLIRAYSTLEIPRYTVDLDLLARGISIDETRKAFESAMQVEMDDGFIFKGMTRFPMERDMPYGGDRFEIGWTLFGKGQSEALKIDVAAGDVVTPDKILEVDLFLCPEDSTEISYLVYPVEFIIAEKLETVFRFGTGNTRVKDLIDLWGLTQGTLDADKVSEAVTLCFTNRKCKYDLQVWRKILSDQDYQEFVQKALVRNYSHLKVPSAQILFEHLMEFSRNVSFRPERL